MEQREQGAAHFAHAAAEVGEPEAARGVERGALVEQHAAPMASRARATAVAAAGAQGLKFGHGGFALSLSGSSLSLLARAAYPARPRTESTHMSDPYKALDFYNVDELYSDEERMIRDTVRTWVSDRFLPVIEEHNRASTFPMHLIP